MSFERIIAFDTSMISENAGDDIIMKYINGVLRDIWPDDYIVHIPTHEFMGKQGHYFCSQASMKVVCGTNILTSNMMRTKMWSVRWRDVPYIEDSVLLGVGWREYENEPDPYTTWFWRGILSKRYQHSVRDRYSEKRLKSLGISNVLYTGCPTMWSLTPELCSSVPTHKARNVITTVTNYRPTNPENDKYMIQTLVQHYKNVYLWVQALEDYRYVQRLGIDSSVKLIAPGLDNFEKALSDGDLDYCGTRLHAGIEAIHHGKRAIIIGKDNRAIEIAKDTGLNVLPEDEIKSLPELLDSEIITNISMPTDNIRAWVEQFK